MREVRIKLVSNDPVMDYAISKPEDAIVVMQSLIGDIGNNSDTFSIISAYKQYF